jgi:PPK2 family polyphosphate:nucleotide phosphotransferase
MKNILTIYSYDQRIGLKNYDPDDTLGLTENDIKKEFGELKEKLIDLQEVFFASKEYALLIVLQGMDCSGKDGTVKKVLGCLNPNGLRVESFIEPTPLELGHDYLWRTHNKTPRRGNIVVFNRSYYEDVLVTRVHQAIDDETAFQRFEDINAYEQYLMNNHTIVLKFFLHISKEFQQQKLRSRLELPKKHWKFSESDLIERKHWDAYQKCYTEVLSRCSTERIPWYVIPANYRWFAHYIILKTIVITLEELDLVYPKLEGNIDALIREVNKSADT